MEKGQSWVACFEVARLFLKYLKILQRSLEKNGEEGVDKDEEMERKVL